MARETAWQQIDRERAEKRQKDLDTEISWSEFKAGELRDFEAWVSKDQSRTLRSWLFAMQRFAVGDR